MMTRVSSWGIVVAAVALIVCTASVARAQTTFGVRAGLSGTPDQFYAGGHLETGPIADRIHFRPNVEVGVGHHLTLVAVNLEFIFRNPIQSSRWTLFAGAGPSANFFSSTRGPGRGNSTDVGGGLNLLIGTEHEGGFFTELKVGLADSPSVKFGVGLSFGR